MPFVPSHMRMKPQQAQQQSNDVQVTEPSPQQQKVVEQTASNNQDQQENSYDFETELEDFLVSILDEMTAIKKMIAEQNTHGNEDNAHDTTHDNKATKSLMPAVEVEKRTGLVERGSNSNAQDFSDCF